MLNWVISENCEMDEDCSEAAIENNRTDMFLILRDAGCLVPKEICSNAAYEGDFDVLKWLHEDEGYDLHPLSLLRGHKLHFLPELIFPYLKPGYSLNFCNLPSSEEMISLSKKLVPEQEKLQRDRAAAEKQFYCWMFSHLGRSPYFVKVV